MLDGQQLLPRDRISALNEGCDRYFTGVPCKRGHVDYRITSNGLCRVCRNENAAKCRNKKASKDPSRHAADLTARRDRRRKSCIFDPMGRWSAHVRSASSYRARLKNIPYDLTAEYIRGLCVETCPALGIKLIYCNPTHQVDTSANLDRIVPELGYVKGNVRVISKLANVIRTNAKTEQIGMVYRWLLKQEASTDQ